MKTARQLAQAIDPKWVAVTGSIRRMAISLTAKTLWQLVGFRIGTKTETLPAETFLGIGFHARPSSSGKPEAIVLMVNGQDAPVVVAVRDEKTRAAIAGALLEDETAMFNTQAIVVAKADGSIEARSAAGVALPLATKADLTALKTAITNAVIVATDGGASFKATLLAALGAWPAGTTTFKAE